MNFKITNPDHKYFGHTGTIKFIEIDIDGILVTHVQPRDGYYISEVELLSQKQIDDEEICEFCGKCSDVETSSGDLMSRKRDTSSLNVSARLTKIYEILEQEYNRTHSKHLELGWLQNLPELQKCSCPVAKAMAEIIILEVEYTLEESQDQERSKC